MRYYRLPNRPELIVDQLGVALIDPQGNYIGWDGPVLTDGGAISTQNRGRQVAASRTQDTRGL
jgi:hypothetical protein